MMTATIFVADELDVDLDDFAAALGARVTFGDAAEYEGGFEPDVIGSGTDLEIFCSAYEGLYALD